jgi:hypothetical protein
MFLGGIPVVRGEDKPTPKDLGKIQPPGGVPLLIFGPKGEATVEDAKTGRFFLGRLRRVRVRSDLVKNRHSRPSKKASCPAGLVWLGFYISPESGRGIWNQCKITKAQKTT